MMLYELNDIKRKNRFYQLVKFLESEMIDKNDRVYVSTDVNSKSKVVIINTAIVKIALTEDSEEFFDFSVGSYNKESIIKSMLTIKVDCWGFGRNELIDIPLSMECNLEKIIYKVVKVSEKFKFENKLTEIMKTITTNEIYAYDIRYSCCHYSGNFRPDHFIIYSKNKTFIFYVE